MKSIFSIIKLLIILSFIATPIFATSGHQYRPTLDKVYRTSKINGSYYFLLLSSNGSYYYIRTNKTKTLTVSELKSPNILNILNKKQSWGDVFNFNGKYIKKDGKIYTEGFSDKIEIESSKTIKYQNKIFYLQ
ncbi:hypothetical protein MNB_SV-12-235 [hydrothermal vent metagenome]|uniref:Uncharacterized protein n=1 Tax=hydrothermal vent metagenome TaxID=652676 RepID=A0A1W1CJ60_9ZZZZ